MSSRPIGAFAEQAHTTRARAVRGNIITRPGLTAGFDRQRAPQLDSTELCI